MKELYTEKSIGEETEIWAEGFNSWTKLSAVAQFRWTVCCRDGRADSTTTMPGASSARYTLTQLTTIVLDTFIQMCQFFPSRDEGGAVIRPMPHIKKFLSDPVLLYQIAQLLLTYDPKVVQGVATLILDVMQDSPYVSRLYLSGIYYFLLIYSGSDIVPIAKLLYYTHLKQAYIPISVSFWGEI